jgi:purine nucleoside permease
MQQRFRKMATLTASMAMATALLDGPSTTRAASAGGVARTVKVLIISMFGPESEPWISGFGLDQQIAVPGLSADYPVVRCNADDVCQVTTGMGHANVAASISAVVFSGEFELKSSYFLIAGIAGIDPTQGTLGSAAWARYLIDFGIQWEIDARELPSDWSTGYLGINTRSPQEKPPLDYRTEVFQLNEDLLQAALALSRSAVLSDSPEAMAYRSNWDIAPANQPPSVVQCDTAAGDTWWHGALLEKRAQDWTKILTDGQGTYCTTQQEDNSTFEALRRGERAGRLSTARVAVLRTGSNFDRPHPGQTAYDSLVTSISGGFVPSLQNLSNAGGPLVTAIVSDWAQWQNGVPVIDPAVSPAE